MFRKDLEYVTGLLNNKDYNHFLFPLLYDYSTCEFVELDELLAIVTTYLEPFNQELLASMEQLS
jgi:hypothetical protein